MTELDPLNVADSYVACSIVERASGSGIPGAQIGFLEFIPIVGYLAKP